MGQSPDRYTASGTTTTWLPMLDLDGSTIGLVNAANVDAGPVTTYTCDPSGNPTVSGTPNDWPFQYQGMEKEFIDPAPYYYGGQRPVLQSATRALVVMDNEKAAADLIRDRSLMRASSCSASRRREKRL